ncbi:hypothetical protein ACYG9Z_26280 [Mesorhizobium sp. RSR380A]|uniref:hypothetical protein n=1 Tax=Mesorhizobium sp. LNJC380A00 TaxID=1287264 RepID=UPI0003CEE62F|nr:hypothetical protein [Mesorhizobium sp. LNJC380A00]ESY50714.1 hypothetical protein X746_03630 [Mesorhizobium sp. LNJC380A00]
MHIVDVVRDIASLDCERSHAGHGVLGVHRQIEHGDIELVGVDQNRAKRRVQVAFNSDSTPERSSQQHRKLFDPSVQISAFGRKRLAPRERKQLLRKCPAVLCSSEQFFDQDG